MCLKYDLSVRELMDFFSPEGHRGFSEENVRAAEERLGVRLPAAYREFLTAYGGDPVNTLFNQLVPPEELLTSYQAISTDLEDRELEFRRAVKEGDKYAGSVYLKLWQTPMCQWDGVTENYVLLWFENQGVWSAGYRLWDLLSGQTDPPVYISTEDDFITYRKCTDNTEDFLWEMLREAAGELDGRRFTRQAEIEAALSAAGADPARLKSRSASGGAPGRFGSCLDTEHNMLYFYYETDGYQELTVCARTGTKGRQCLDAAVPAVPKISCPEPCRLRLTPNQKKDLGMDRPVRPDGIALHPLIALAVQETFGHMPAAAYDWERDLARLKTLKLQLSQKTVLTQKDARRAYMRPPGDHPPPEPYYFDLFDWSAIGRMTSLRTLILEKLYVDDFSFLTGCGNLRTLSLYGTNFTDCRLLSELPNLRSADLRFCRLEHTDALEKLSAKFLL